MMRIFPWLLLLMRRRADMVDVIDLDEVSRRN